jgi:hypothetical protein
MAVTTNQLIRQQEGEKISYPVAASTHIYQGTLVFVTAAGYASDGTATGANRLAGIAISEIDNSSGAAGDLNVEVWADEDVFELTGSGFVQADVGKVCYATDNYTITTTYSASAVRVGVVVGFVSSTKLQVKVRPSGSAELAYVSVAASTAVTNTVTETAFDTAYTIPANALRPGDVIRVVAQAIATATNSTDTLNLKLRLGTTAILATGAVDVANSDIGLICADIVVRTIGASGTMVAAGLTGLGASGTGTGKVTNLASTTLDTTAAQSVNVSATWSVANAGNSCRLDVMNVQILRKG